MAVSCLVSCLVAGELGAETVTISRVTSPPRLSDFATAQPGQGPEQTLTKIEGLVQRTPVDGAPVSERTAVYLGYDEHRLYAVFVCAAAPGEIRAHRVNRDRLPDDDDSIALQLDTFRDGRRLYGFQVNPAGVQVDGIYTEGKGWDLSFDTIWTAETAILDDGYVVMITVPFSSVRFRSDGEQRWGLFVYRGIPRRNEEAFWPANSTRHQGRLAYAAELTGMNAIETRQLGQLIPYASSRAGRSTPGREASTQRMVSGQAGVDAKIVAHDSLVLDLTGNPDFSQVESDEPQTTVNQRFEVFFPEKRPFFVENAAYFETPFQVLFTRRIRDPRIGARFTGKAGRYAVGALVADDVALGSAGGEQAGDSRALTTVLRVSRDVGTDSQVGAIYAGRLESPWQNHVGGLDARWRLNASWVATGQALASRSESDLSAASGRAVQGTLKGMGHRYDYQLTASDVSREFQASTGFIPRTGIRDVSQTSGLTFRPSGRIVTAWGPTLALSRVWDHGGRPLDEMARFDTRIELPRQTALSAFGIVKTERIGPESFDSAPVGAHGEGLLAFTERSAGATLASAPFSRVAFSTEVSAGTAINLSPEAGGLPALCDARSMTLTTSIRPTTALSVDTTWIWTRLADRDTGSAVFSDSILRSRANYQATRRLSVRAIVRYERLTRDAARSSLDRLDDLNVDLLFTYLVQPGTAVYAGFNSDRRRASFARGDQVFVKVSYLLHF